MKPFFFNGPLPASKSLLNRALICASYKKSISISGDSLCDDVLAMKDGLDSLDTGKSINCKGAGTTLRFLSFKASRIPGSYTLQGSQRLFQRPQQELLNVLKQLGVQANISGNSLQIQSQGWKIPKQPIIVDRSSSSQFISGLVLNSWELDFPLNIHWNSPVVSDSYWKMTSKLVKDFGMELYETPRSLTIPAHQEIKLKNFSAEMDLSSSFAIAAMAALHGEAQFQNFPHESLQPDLVFVEILRKMNISVKEENSNLYIKKNVPLKPIEWNLQNAPDLFPVLAVLCAFSPGCSRLYGAPQLVHKESNRITKVKELLEKSGVSCTSTNDGMLIEGQTHFSPKAFDYDTDHDHRLAFAASLLKKQGLDINILNPQVVNKSFPEFWQIIGETP